VRDAARGELFVIELKRTEESGGEVATVTIIPAGQDDTE